VGERNFKAENDFWGDDPAPGRSKELKMTWYEGDQKKDGVAGEGNSISLPNDPSVNATNLLSIYTGANNNDYKS